MNHAYKKQITTSGYPMLRGLISRSLARAAHLGYRAQHHQCTLGTPGFVPVSPRVVHDLGCHARRSKTDIMAEVTPSTPSKALESAVEETAAKPSPPSSARKRAAVKRAAAAPASDAAADVPEPSPRKRRVSKPKAAAAVVADVQGQDQGEPAAPAAADAAAQPESAAPAAKKKSPAKRKPKVPAGPDYDASMRPPACTAPCTRILSWNVAGMRALLKKDPEALKRLVDQEQVDVLCLQEHKLQTSHVEKVSQEAGLPGWHVTWSCSEDKKGYAGTAVLCRQPPLSTQVGLQLPDHDGEGRVVTVELPGFWVVNTYVPNSSDGLKRLDYRVGSWDKALAAYVAKLQQTKPVVLTGDLNCAHQEIDIHDPKRNLRSAGFTQEERDSFSAGLLGEVGLVDTFRSQHPGVVGYTYYSYRFNARASGRGWRLDYFLVSSSLADNVHDSYILKEVTGSDHVPIGLVVKN